MTGGMAASGLDVVEVDVGERKCRLITYTGDETALYKMLGDQVVSKGRFEKGVDGATYRVVVVGGGGVGTSALTIKYEDDDALFRVARGMMEEALDELDGLRGGLNLLLVDRDETLITPEMREPERAATRLRVWGETWGNFMRVSSAVRLIDWERFDELTARNAVQQLREQMHADEEGILVRLERFGIADSNPAQMIAEAMADREVQRAAERKAARKQQKKDRKVERRHQQRAAREAMRRCGKR